MHDASIDFTEANRKFWSDPDLHPSGHCVYSFRHISGMRMVFG
jgi:hypothetical protein